MILTFIGGLICENEELPDINWQDYLIDLVQEKN